MMTNFSVDIKSAAALFVHERRINQFSTILGEPFVLCLFAEFAFGVPIGLVDVIPTNKALQFFRISFMCGEAV
jgi:hypothetical protein